MKRFSPDDERQSSTPKQFCGHGHDRNRGPCQDCADVDAVEKRGNLRWDPTDGSGRWQCGDHGIHAGDGMEVELAPGQWVPCVIESADSGRKLLAYFGVEQLLGTQVRAKVEFDSGLSRPCATINTHTVNLRWPSGRWS